jgi:hypothetical protein
VILLELFEAAYLVDMGELSLLDGERTLTRAEVLQLLLRHDTRCANDAPLFDGLMMT